MFKLLPSKVWVKLKLIADASVVCKPEGTVGHPYAERSIKGRHVTGHIMPKGSSVVYPCGGACSRMVRLMPYVAAKGVYPVIIIA
tara:strand:+ start:226 stop:480 length:255 start_codon:yes stop_codon:yes gene_type:complete